MQVILKKEHILITCLKEIDEQPLVIRKIIQKYQNEKGELTIDEEIVQAVKKQTVFILLQQEHLIMRVSWKAVY